MINNKANLRDLITATSLVILLKLDSNWFFLLCDLEIWWMTRQIIRHIFYTTLKLCVSFHIHQWIQVGVTVWKRPIWVKFNDFFQLCYLAIWSMTLKNKRAPLSCYFKLCTSFHSHCEFKLELLSGNAQFESKSTIFLCDLAIWCMILSNNWAPLLCYFKLFA